MKNGIFTHAVDYRCMEHSCLVSLLCCRGPCRTEIDVDKLVGRSAWEVDLECALHLDLHDLHRQRDVGFHHLGQKLIMHGGNKTAPDLRLAECPIDSAKGSQHQIGRIALD